MVTPKVMEIDFRFQGEYSDFVQIPFEKPTPAGFHDPSIASMDRFDKDGNIEKVDFTIFGVCNF